MPKIQKDIVLKGLECANCALDIENEVKTLDGVTNASVNFVTQKLTLEVTHENELERIIHQASKIAVSIEAGIKVIVDGEDHENQHDEVITKYKIIRIVIGTIFFVLALILKLSGWAEFSMFFVSYLLIGGDVLLRAIVNISRGRVFDENFLMGVATVGAFAIKQFPEGVAVMLFYQVGMFFESIAVNRSRKSISALLNIRPDYANLKTIDGIVVRVVPTDVHVGDEIIIKPGEKIPLDGRILDGKALIDTSTLTGESVLRESETGDEVLAGMINTNGLLTVEVTKEFGESTVSKILDLVQNAHSKKAPTENFITKFARYYTPIVVIIAAGMAIIPPIIFPSESFSNWINRALVFLVVSCPCALVISIPLGFFGGIAGASKQGILIKGSNYLEALNNVDTAIFDKTGTITKGVFNVSKVISMTDQKDEDILEYAAYAESYSSHPIALSIIRAYGKKIDQTVIEEYSEISGHGIKAKIHGKEILAGNKKLMDSQKVKHKDVDEVGTFVHVAVNGIYVGYIVISDEIREDSRKAVDGLKAIGIKKLVMLTGDNKKVADNVGKQLNFDEVYSELLPDQKLEHLETLEIQKKSKGKILFVGDGINDAPVIARADIGIAMGGLGSDAAIEAADVVIMTDEPSKVVTAIKIAKRTKNIVWQNIIFALGIKAIVLVMGAGGLATMWEAVFADVGVAVIAILNAMRVMKNN